MSIPSHPLLVVYVAWHPNFANGQVMAKRLYDYFRRDWYQDVAGGAGLSVVYRSEPDSTTNAPAIVNLDESETSAIVLLFDSNFATDASYLAWARTLIGQADEAGVRMRVIPVDIDGVFVDMGFTLQAIRWNQLLEFKEDPSHSLIYELTYEFSRMLRSFLERLRRPQQADDELARYLERIKVFICHSKHDEHGGVIAETVHHALSRGNFSAFFDLYNIPAGLDSKHVIPFHVRRSAVIAIHTDSFSSREWCRREIIEAKRHQVPLVVANCIEDRDERCFPYMGNVPMVRMSPGASDRIEHIIGCLLFEILKDFYWRCLAELAKSGSPANTVFLPRPPELISLAGPSSSSHANVTLVYPNPPLGQEEQDLFEEIVPTVRLRSLNEWLAES